MASTFPGSAESAALFNAAYRRSVGRRKHPVKIAANVLVAIVALEHLGFLVLEMFLWNTPVGIRVFDLTPSFAEQSAGLAANQGLYNGFLSAGLIWSLLRGPSGFPQKVFFLSCVVVAGVFGALTAKGSILLVQAAPALITLVLVVLSREKPGSSECAA